MRSPRDHLLLFVLLLPIAGVSWCGLERIAFQRRQNLESELRAILATTQDGLRLWAREARFDVAYWAQTDQVRTHVERLLAQPPQADALRASPDVAALRRALEPVMKMKGYLGFAAIAADGTQVAGARDANIGTSLFRRADPGTIVGALQGKNLLGLPVRLDKPGNGEGSELREVMLVAAPIRDEGGRVVAALAFVIDPGRDFTRVAQSGWRGKTGETYALDRAGRMLTETRFDSQLRQLGLLGPGERGMLFYVRDPGGNLLEGHRSALPAEAQPLTVAARDVVAGNAGVNLDGYRDYRGVPVVGAWAWDDELGFGLATELDVSEAYASLHTTRQVTLFMLVVTVVGAAAVAAVLWQRARVLKASFAREQLTLSRLEQSYHELARTQEQLVRRERMAALGELAAIVAHEVRNPLGVIFNSLGSLQKILQPKGDAQSLLTMVGEEAERLNRIVGDLLDFARMREPQMEPEPLQDIISGAIEVATGAAGNGRVRVKTQLAPGLPLVQVDALMVRQALINLLVNSIQAMPQGGTVTVAAVEEPHGGRPMARVEISDEGPGIPAELAHRIFEPFFTTKAQGTGLGLAVVKRIVDAHHGEVGFEATQGRGARFTVRLPLA